MSTRNVPKIPKTAREVRLTKQLEGELTLDHFDIVETQVPQPSRGEVLVRTDYLSLAAAYADLMRPGCQLPVPPFLPSERLGGGVLGTVVRSASQTLAAGDLVQSMSGWSEYSAGPAEAYVKLEPGLFPSPVYFLSQGPTAYYGMADIARAGEGDVVFVSGAAGGVGSLAGQIAKCRGAAQVIGSAGSKEKADYLVDELGYDAAFDYHDGPVVDHLRELAPDGINVFFDNVGGEQFEAAVQVAAPHARFALCGALAGQIGDGQAGHPKFDLMRAITRHLEIRPFACYHTPEQINAWYEHFVQWHREGRFVFPHTTVEGGLTQAPEAMLALLKGRYRGNVAVRVTSG
ncbi:NADP-dependent oxidoreductase [Streptomyces sp. NBC_00654]|uniref:MDR family NADP-dependent oxidoreductase n=1 Tax=Streptomyces sp. NBC_00654 TaxID=2975799 RepID=UPI00224C9660|nr:NADP-dependent oxidoreductase [Streptomyces sp. NBC_00654]MCX4970532.1 NADP-dependent oxidoreductase [Streptomyces sp. NBC_00654]